MHSKSDINRGFCTFPCKQIWGFRQKELFLHRERCYVKLIMEQVERIFRRKIYSQMLKLKQERDGKTALLIKGA